MEWNDDCVTARVNGCKATCAQTKIFVMNVKYVECNGMGPWAMQPRPPHGSVQA
jgi:hypothetical protein